MEDSVYLFEKLADHGENYLNKKDYLKSVFFLEEEPTEDTIFSVDIYEELEDIDAADLYLIYITG